MLCNSICRMFSRSRPVAKLLLLVATAVLCRISGKKCSMFKPMTALLAAILADGSVVTCGNAARGGDSRVVQKRLKNVQQIQATPCAFAAILGDGSVLTWGSPVHGGDSSAVKDQLQDVQQIQATLYGFAAIRSDGSVVTWSSRSVVVTAALCRIS